MSRGFGMGILPLAALALISAALYPGYSTAVSHAIHEQTRYEVRPRNRVTGVELPPAPTLVDLFIHHVPSPPTR